MTDQPAQEVRLLRAAYAAFNARDIDAALALMTADVTWPKAFKGGFVRGPDEIRAYWTEKWSEIDPPVEPVAFYPQADSQVLVDEIGRASCRARVWPYVWNLVVAVDLK